jgi:uncharacterized damage-inducible protein DinB
MHDTKVLANVFRRNMGVIKRQAEGLSHADSLLQPEARGNCLNFILGHILVYRGILTEMLGLERVVPKAETERYERESEPITADGEGVLQLARLLELLAQAGDTLSNAVEGLSAEDLNKEVVVGESNTTVGQRLEFYGWHETYHVGQTEYLRQLAGPDDKVI